MYVLKNLIVILFVLCSSQYSYGAVEVVRKSQTFEDSIFFINEKSFNNGILVYALCDSSTERTRNCKIVQENYPYNEAAYSCQVTIHNYHFRGGHSIFQLLVIALGEDKAVLYWEYPRPVDHFRTIKIGTLDFKTCEMNSIDVPDCGSWLQLFYNNRFVYYKDDSFDVFYPDPTRHPENADLLKLHIDGDGKMISEPKIVNVEKGVYLSVYTVAHHSPAKGYLFVKRNQFNSRKDFLQPQIWQVLLVKPDGTSKHLAEYRRDMLGSVAAENNFISFCRKSEDKGHIVCTQYDEYGNILFTTTLVTKNFDIDVIRSYNLPNGGMLVLNGAIQYKLQEPINKKTVYELVWIGSNGKEKGRMYDKKLQIPKGMTGVPYIYANGDDHYCATVVIRSKYIVPSESDMVPVNLDVVASCFTPNDLLSR